MMRSLIRTGVVSAWLALAGGCSNPVSEAQEKFEFLRNSGSLIEACAAGKEWKARAASTKDEQTYLSATINADSTCYDLQIYERDGYDPRHPEVQADNLEIGATP